MHLPILDNKDISSTSPTEIGELQIFDVSGILKHYRCIEAPAHRGTNKSAHQASFRRSFVYGLELMTLKTLIFSATGGVTCNFHQFIRVYRGHILAKDR